MPQTTLENSSWAMMLPPAATIARAPASPSRPMPVSTTPSVPPPQMPRRRTKKHVGRRATGVFGRAVREPDPHRSPSLDELQVASSTRDHDIPAGHGLAVRRLADRHPADLGEPLGELAREERRHVLDDEHRDRGVRHEGGQGFGQALGPPGRDADHDAANRLAAARRHQPGRRWGSGGTRDGIRPGHERLDPRDQLAADPGGDVVRTRSGWLRHVVVGARQQRVDASPWPRAP